jgi:hypothetical protein
MRIAYLILAHNNPAHLQRLVQRLAGPESSFYVHIDAKSNLDEFAGLTPAVTFCARRVNCAWGDISLVEATLELMRCASSAPGGFDRFVLLSGACYPLQTVEYINSFFERSRTTEFIEVFPLPNAEFKKPLERLTRYSIPKGKPLARFRWPFQHFLNRVLPLRDYERALAGREPVCGSQWWCLSGDAVRHVLDVTAREPALYRFCKFVDCPDEFYIQAILWNSPFKAHISHSLTFTHWMPGKDSPELLDASYLPRFAGPVLRDSESNNSPGEKGEVLFARKFSDASTSVLDAIDILATQRQRGPDAEQVLTTYKVSNGQN